MEYIISINGLHFSSAVLGYGIAYLTAKKYIKVPLEHYKNRLVELSERNRLHYIQMMVSLIYSHFIVFSGVITLMIEGIEIGSEITTGQRLILYNSLGFLFYDSLLTYFENINIVFVYIHHLIAALAILAALVSNKGVWISVICLICCEVSHYWHVKNEVFKLTNTWQNHQKVRRNFIIYFIKYFIARGFGVTWCFYQLITVIEIPFIYALLTWQISAFNFVMINAMLKKFYRTFFQTPISNALNQIKKESSQESWSDTPSKIQIESKIAKIRFFTNEMTDLIIVTITGIFPVLYAYYIRLNSEENTMQI